MDHSQRSANSDISNSTSTSSSLMPNVLFREIHKNAFLKRHSSDRRTGFPRKSEKVWVVFCVHDDVEPFLEIYPDQKVALTHKPEWFASLSNALHVSPSICGHEDEFEFAVTLSFQVVRLAAPSWESMMEWVETIRNKLRELKVLCPKENIYSKMPEQKQPLLPTRDPNSPLPLPPEGPSTILPGVELVHIENRSNIASNSEVGRHQRETHSRNNINNDRRINKRRETPVERDIHIVRDVPVNESSSSVIAPSDNSESVSVLETPSTSVNIISGQHPVKPKAKRAASAPQPPPSSSISLGSNVTVIEVSTSNDRENNSAADSTPVVNLGNISENEDDEVFLNSSFNKKSEIKNVSAHNSSSDETHYEHVFLSNVHLLKGPDCKTASNCVESNKSKKSHSTSVMISPINSNPASSSQNDNFPSTSSINVGSEDILAGNATCVNVTKSAIVNESGNCDKNCPLSPQTQSKLEKVNISGLIPRVTAKATKSEVVKPVSVSMRDSNLNVVEIKKFTVEGDNQKVMPVSQEQNVPSGDNVKVINAPGPSSPAYSQVKKVPKNRVKNENLRCEEHLPKHLVSPILSRKKNIEMKTADNESHENRKSENLPNSNGSRNQIILPCGRLSSKIMPSPKVHGNKKSEVSNINIIKDASRNIEQAQCNSNVSNNEYKNEITNSAPSTSGNNSRVHITKKESLTNNSNNNTEIEPITASIQPTVGVISVEDIPLIGGHQRRRRRSSSSDATPVSSTPSSRGIGGADRIRINVPLMGNPSVRERETPRNETETRSSSHSRNNMESHVNIPSPSSRLTLREQQVLQLKKEMLHPGGVRLQLRRKDCTGSIALVDVLNGVWVAGWKQKEHPLLYNALHIGDQLISVSDVVVRSSAEAQKLIRSSASLYIEFIIRRVPFGNVFALQRSSDGQNLGIIQEGNTAEIKDVVPNSIAARQGLTAKTPSYDGLSLTTWFLTEINGRPLNLFFKDNEVRDRLNSVGKEISILVQPHDFIKQIKKQLKNLRGYKEYIVQ